MKIEISPILGKAVYQYMRIVTAYVIGIVIYQAIKIAVTHVTDMIVKGNKAAKLCEQGLLCVYLCPFVKNGLQNKPR